MLLLNRIKTPDGTILTSRHVHDLQAHKDKNGLWYMVDGGLSYLRRSVPGDYTDLSVEDDGTIETARQHLEWGTYGKDPEYHEMRYVRLMDMSNAHIEAILNDCTSGKLPLLGQYLRYFNKELEYRDENGILVED